MAQVHLGGLELTKKRYKALALAVTLATALAAMQAPAFAAPEDEEMAEGKAIEEDMQEAGSQQPPEMELSEASSVVSSIAEEAAGNTAKPQDEESEVVREWRSTRPEESDVSNRMKEMEGKTVVDITCTGASDATAKTAQAALAQRAGDAFTADALEKDRAAIYATGYFYDLYPTFEQVPEGVIITYHLLENPVLASVSLVGNNVEKTEDLQPLLTVTPGEILNGTELQKNVRDIQAKYREDGYILAKVSNLHIDSDGALTITINEGTLEGYKVKGNEKTKDYVVLREMRMKEGEAFNVKKARRSMQRVYNLGFFEDVNMKLNPGVEPNAVILEVDVKEKRTGTFGLGAGYSSDDGFLGMISVGDTNFRGTGDAVNFTYEFSGDDDDAHGYTFSWRHPWLDKRETAGTIRLYNRTYKYNDYDERGHRKEEFMRQYSGGEVSFSRPVSEYSKNTITLRNRKEKYVKYEKHGYLRRDGDDYKKWRHDNFGTTRSITLEHTTDTRDNAFFPTTGGKVTLTTEWAGFGADFNYSKHSIEDQRYFKVGHAQVFAARAQYGFGDGDIPEFSQYRIGGQGSIRGYRDEQFRGDRMFLGSIEYRFPIVSKVQGALFTDWGGAWDTGIAPKHIHGSGGLGVQIQTPIGPLRLDYGIGDDGGRAHFSVGGQF